MHPDCAALLFLAVNDGRMEPLERYVDIRGMYERMARTRGPLNRPWAFVLLSLYLFRSLRRGKALAFYRMLLNTWLKRGKRSLMIVAVEQFMSEAHQDEERIERCTTCNVLEDGELVPACIFQHPDARRHPRTRGSTVGR